MPYKYIVMSIFALLILNACENLPSAELKKPADSSQTKASATVSEKSTDADETKRTTPISPESDVNKTPLALSVSIEEYSKKFFAILDEHNQKFSKNMNGLSVDELRYMSPHTVIGTPSTSDTEITDPAAIEPSTEEGPQLSDELRAKLVLLYTNHSNYSKSRSASIKAMSVPADDVDNHQKLMAAYVLYEQLLAALNGDLKIPDNQAPFVASKKTKDLQTEWLEKNKGVASYYHRLLSHVYLPEFKDKQTFEATDLASYLAHIRPPLVRAGAYDILGSSPNPLRGLLDFNLSVSAVSLTSSNFRQAFIKSTTKRRGQYKDILGVLGLYKVPKEAEVIFAFVYSRIELELLLLNKLEPAVLDWSTELRKLITSPTEVSDINEKGKEIGDQFLIRVLEAFSKTKVLNAVEQVAFFSESHKDLVKQIQVE